MLRVAICDDDVGFLGDFTRKLIKAFADAGQQVDILAFFDGRSLIGKVEKDKQIFDVVFLDVEMPGVDGFQTAQRLRELNTAFVLVFTTHMENQSREGYRFGAFRYVYKRNLEAETAEAVSAILSKLGLSQADEEGVTFKCRTSGVLEDVTLKKKDIVFLQLEKSRRVTLKTACSEYALLVRPLSEYAKQLTPPSFVPIMRNYLLNFNHVESIQDGSFVLTGGLAVPLGTKREVRKASMEKYLQFLEGRL